MSWNAHKNPDKIRARLDRARKKLESEGVHVAQRTGSRGGLRTTASGFGNATTRPRTVSYRSRGGSRQGGGFGDYGGVEESNGGTSRFNLGSYRYLKQTSSSRPSSSSAMVRRQGGGWVGSRGAGGGQQSFFSNNVTKIFCVTLGNTPSISSCSEGSQERGGRHPRGEKSAWDANHPSQQFSS